ncbi:MAG: glycosyltransferase [Xanthomonadales bacterium]|jgi:glycosyltransferase involved in cell wall biosynthesis|nr:glycosyltransferase [Xanthomonadales bacterium]
MKKASFILPPFLAHELLVRCLDSLLEQDQDDIEILLFQEKAGDGLSVPAPDNFPNLVALPAAEPNENLPGLLNRAASASAGEVLFFVAECVTFAPGFTRTYLDRLCRQAEAGWVYGCFHEAADGRPDVLRDVLTDVYDYSEGSQIGPVRGIRKSCLDAVGCYDESIPYAFEYDLRLRLSEHFDAARVEQPLYRVRPENRLAAVRLEMSHYRCYAPASGPESPRSYLDYTTDEEEDFRSACTRSLARRGALIDEPAGPMSCPHPFSPEQAVTVIIPLWNREDYIGPALESVLQTQDCAFEVVVVDNGSSDRGPEIVRSYADHAPVRLIHNTVNNIAGALNAGIRASKGKYICQLDSDDLYTARTLPTLLRYMENRPGAALGISYYDYIGPDGEQLTDLGVTRHLEYDPNNLVRTDGIGHARIWHRCVLEKLGGFDEQHLGNYAEDYDLQLKLCEQYEILRIPHVLYHYRINHKKPGETMPYSERHRKKTFARRAALERRKRMNSGAVVLY